MACFFGPAMKIPYPKTFEFPVHSVQLSSRPSLVSYAQNNLQSPRIVETEQILHMNGGEGETSYARNSLLQRKVISEVKPILEESVTKLYNTLFPDCLKVGDLGCSSGPNAFLVASEIIDTIDAKSRSLNRQPPAFQIFLNDLPGNDFNTIFKSLPNFYTALENEKGSQFGPCFIAGIPGSFYGRLFPANSMHFFHSSSSAHWLSQVPKGLTDGLAPVKNKGNIYVTNSSSPAVYRAFVEQFQQDFKLFLRSRSEELVPGGSMVVTIGGRTETEELVSPWGLLGMTLNDMVLENLIEEEKLENFDISLYYPTAEEVRQVIDTEECLSLERMDIFQIGWDANIRESKENRGKFISNLIRAGSEPLLKTHFGEAILDDVFIRFTEKIVKLLEVEEFEYTSLVISMTKNA